MNTDPTGTEPITIMAIIAALLFSTFMGTMSGIAGAAINNRHIGIGAAIGAIGGLLNGAATLFAGASGALYLIPFTAAAIAGASEYFNQLFNHEDLNLFSIFYAAGCAFVTGGITYYIGTELGSVIGDALSYILTPVIFGVQTIFDSIVSIFNPFERIFNWFKKIFNFGGKETASASSGSSNFGGGFGGGGGSSW